jgi:hypothetical protein
MDIVVFLAGPRKNFPRRLLFDRRATFVVQSAREGHAFMGQGRRQGDCLRRAVGTRQPPKLLPKSLKILQLLFQGFKDALDMLLQVGSTRNSVSICTRCRIAQKIWPRFSLRRRM